LGAGNLFLLPPLTRCLLTISSQPFHYLITAEGLMLLAAERQRVAEEEQQTGSAVLQERREEKEERPAGAKQGQKKQAAGMRGVVKKVGVKRGE
jgi:hypothetical protein